MQGLEVTRSANSILGIRRVGDACLISCLISRYLGRVASNITPSNSTAMAQVNNHFNQNSLCSLPPDNILNLVNEQLLEPTDQQRTSELENYFLGYKEYLETPPSPGLSDPDQLFSYFEQSGTNLDEALTISPSRRVLLQNPPEAESQGRENCSSTPAQG